VSSCAFSNGVKLSFESSILYVCMHFYCIVVMFDGFISGISQWDL
jgi:hypothetical protein